MQYCIGRTGAKSFGIFIGKTFCQYYYGLKILRVQRGGKCNCYGKKTEAHTKNLVGKSEEKVTLIYLLRSGY